MNCICGHGLVNHRRNRFDVSGACTFPGCECRELRPDDELSARLRHAAKHSRNRRLLGGHRIDRPSYIMPYFTVLSVRPEGTFTGSDKWITLKKPLTGDVALQGFVNGLFEMPVEAAAIVRIHISRDLYAAVPRTFYWWGGDFLEAAERLTRQSIGGSSETHFGITALHEQLAPPHELARSRKEELRLQSHPGWFFYGITTGKHGRPAPQHPPANLEPFRIRGLPKPSPDDLMPRGRLKKR